MKFAQQWNHKGIAIPLTDVHIDFATDWANIVLRNFVQMCALQAKAAMEQAQKANEQKSSIIVEE